MISSLGNQRVKDWMRLYQKKYRRNQYLIFDEDMIRSAIEYGYLDTLIYSQSCEIAFANSVEVSIEVMDKLSKGKGLRYIGVANMLKEGLNNPRRIVILDDLQDPANVGMIISSAYLFGYDSVILNSFTADIYHEKCLDKASDSLYKVNILRCDVREIIPELKREGFKIYATGLRKETKELEETLVYDKMAFILGNEGSGVKEELYELSDEIVKIRMENIDSLNVAIAGSIVMYHFATKQ
ncbi:MAG: TrmH family RNA methyltransferase [Erysipelotrichaceae bacterium]